MRNEETLVASEPEGIVPLRGDPDELLQEQATRIVSLEHSVSELQDECARRTTEANRYRQVLAASGRETNLDFALQLANLPQPAEVVPRRDTLAPCLSKRWRDPSLSFPTEARVTCPPGSTLFLPQRVFWYCPEDIHGIALSPSALYRTRDQSWMENDEFTCLLDQTKEVFYRGPGKGIYYAGTFKCAYTGKLPTSDFRNLPAGVKEELIRTSFSAPEIHNIRTRDERAQLRKLYCDGERKVSFLALQCVGFNQKLYDAFLAVGQLREAEQKPSVSIGKRRRKGEMDSKRAAKMIRDERARSETEVTGDEPIV